MSILRLDGFDEFTDVAPSLWNGAFLCGSHPVLDLGEGLLDGVEVWRVGRQEFDGSAICPVDRLPGERVWRRRMRVETSRMSTGACVKGLFDSWGERLSPRVD